MKVEQEDIPWETFEDELDNGNMIFLYLHGNGGTRHDTFFFLYCKFASFHYIIFFFQLPYLIVSSL